ncbi:MAG: asparagine synthase (glutamine-hydrolyzing) [Candidatus Aureabacteria bacterium]|nr:asparagine synthase (glutamine-hydrolyzing) [Candidatus Auribacterota bacterium]
MCGICGILYGDRTRPVEKATLEEMARLMAHRGPDGEGYYLNGPVGLGHRRLSVIDTEGGTQPMTNEDRTLWLVYNGEVYNFQELAADLKKRGHSFTTRCDTEVILHLYEEYGTGCLSRLRGMFSFALWDERRRRLFCARDRLGVKPFFYSLRNGDFIFASGPAPILSVPGFPRSVSLCAIDLYLTYQYIPSPHSILEGIQKLPPAHYLMFEEGKLTVERYWDIPCGRHTEMSYRESKERLRDLLTEATNLRLISDVPLGAFLSGGIDSSIVVALMSRLTNGGVKTFSIGFEDQSYNELSYARLLSRRYATDHHEFIVKPDAVGLLPKLVRHYGEPFADSSALPTYYVAEMTRRHVTVALNGDAGDELFAGYERYYAFKLAGRLCRIPSVRWQAGLWERVLRSSRRGSLLGKARRFLASLRYSDLSRYLDYVAYFKDQEREKLYAPGMRELSRRFRAPAYLERLYETCPADDPLEKILSVDIHSYLPEDLLVKVDIATMANSLEARSPFLDHRVVEFAASLPVSWKLRGRTSKYILKDTFSDLLPREILQRGKMGFGVPIGSWFRKELRGYLRDILMDPRSLSRGYFDRARIEGLLKEHDCGIADQGYRLWALLILELWHREFIDGAPGGAGARRP